MKKNNGSRSPPIGDHEMTPKRRKMNMIDSSTLSQSQRESRSRTREITALHRKILLARATIDQLRRLKLRIEEVMKQEEMSLNINVNGNEKMMQRLKQSLEKAKWNIGDDPEAQAIVKLEMSQIRSRIWRKFTELLVLKPETIFSSRRDTPVVQKAQKEVALAPSMCSPEEDSEDQASAQVEKAQIKARISSKILNSRTENFRMDHSSRDDTQMLSKAQKNGTKAQKLLNPPEKKVKVRSSQILEEERVHQESNRGKLEETKTEIPKFHLETVAYANKLGQMLPSSEAVVLTLRETGRGMGNLVLVDQGELGGVERVEQLMMFLPERSDGLSSSLQCSESMDSGTWSASVANETSYPPLFTNFSMQDGTAGTVHPDSLGVQPEASLHPTNYEDYTEEVLDLSLPSFDNVDEDCEAEPSGQIQQESWEKSGESSSSLYCYESLENESLSASMCKKRSYSSLIPSVSTQENGKDHAEGFDSPNPSKALNGGDAPPSWKFNNDPEHLRISVGKYYILVSCPLFFEIDWKTHYTRHHPRKFVCKKCSITRNTCSQIEDHIWAAHYGGRFVCPFCTAPYYLAGRHDLDLHIKRHHRDIFPVES